MNGDYKRDSLFVPTFFTICTEFFEVEFGTICTDFFLLPSVQILYSKHNYCLPDLNKVKRQKETHTIEFQNSVGLVLATSTTVVRI